MGMKWVKRVLRVPVIRVNPLNNLHNIKWDCYGSQKYQKYVWIDKNRGEWKEGEHIHPIWEVF